MNNVLLQCILSIFPASVQQFYANLLVFVNINPFLYISDQFALENIKHLRGIAGSIFGISITWIIWKCNNVEQGHWNINQGS